MFAPIAISSKGFAITRVPAVVGCMLLLMSDIPQDFPKLRWGFIESSAQWMPWIRNEAARRYRAANKPFPDNVFEEYRIYVTCQDDDDLPYVLKTAGDNTLCTGTDYGHTDLSSKVDAINMFRERTDVDDATKMRVLHHNPKALYGL